MSFFYDHPIYLGSTLGQIRPYTKIGLGKGSKKEVIFITNQFTYDYVKLKIGYFSNKIPVWEGIFTLENLIN